MRRLLRLIDVVPSAIPVFVPATYAITVAVNWEVLQRQRAWSQSQIFVTHSDQYKLWGEGLAASSGLAHFVKTDDERPFLNEISREASAGFVGDYLVADALSFYDVSVKPANHDELIVVSSHPLVSMVATVHVGSDSWFTGFTGVSAAVPASDYGDDGDDGGGGFVWLDSFTIPIFPYKIDPHPATVQQAGQRRGRENESPEPPPPGDDADAGRFLKGSNKASASGGGGTSSQKFASAGGGGGGGPPELWAKPHLPPGGPISRVVALVETDFNVPLAYVEFHRVKNVWEDSARRGGLFRKWGTSLPLKMPFLLLVGGVGAVAACLGAYVLMNACCAQLKRKNGGYQQVV